MPVHGRLRIGALVRALVAGISEGTLAQTLRIMAVMRCCITVQREAKEPTAPARMRAPLAPRLAPHLALHLAPTGLTAPGD